MKSLVKSYDGITVMSLTLDSSGDIVLTVEVHDNGSPAPRVWKVKSPTIVKFLRGIESEKRYGFTVDGIIVLFESPCAIIRALSETPELVDDVKQVFSSSHPSSLIRSDCTTLEEWRILVRVYFSE